MTQIIKVGLRFLRRGKICFIGQLRLTHQKLEIHSDDGDIVVLSPEAFRREVVVGDIQMLVRDHDGKLCPVSSGWREEERARVKEERNRRAHILKFVDDEVKLGKRLKDIATGLENLCKEQGLGKKPSERTLRNWRNLANGHESMLSPAWDRCGNRHQGPDEILLTTMREVVDVAILGDDLFTCTGAWDLIEARFDERWRQEKKLMPLPNYSIRQLKTFLRSIPWSELIKLRLDGRTARALTRVAVHMHKAGALWDCVEMDATILDLLIRDEYGNEIGRPVLYVAIDVATGYVVGLYLTIQKPSTWPFVECLRFMFFPKPDDFDKKYGIKNRLEVFGKPILLRVDNGTEFICKTATELVRQLFGDTARCKPFKPEEKPHVERFNGTLKAFILKLPGATTSSVNGDKREPQKGEKLLDIEQLRGEIYRFVYDNYSLRANELRSLKSGKAVAPIDIVREMSSTFTVPVPVGRDEFERSLCFKRETRALGHDGIAFDGWQYHSDELATLYQKLGPIKYEFLYSDLDAVTIQVKQPGDGGELIAAFEKILEGSSVDRATAKAIKKQIQAESKELNRRTFPHALAQLRRIQETAKSSRGRAKQARIDDILDAAVEHVQCSTPNPALPTDNATSLTPSPSTGDCINNAPRGRKMGEK